MWRRTWLTLLSSSSVPHGVGRGYFHLEAQLDWDGLLLRLVVGPGCQLGTQLGLSTRLLCSLHWSLHVAWAAGFQKEVFQRCESGSCKSPKAQPHDHFCWILLVKASHTSIQIRNRLFMGEEAKNVQPSLNAPSLTCITSWITCME